MEIVSFYTLHFYWMVIMMAGQTVDIEQVENGLAQPLLGDSESKPNEEEEDDDDEGDASEESAQDSRKPATSIGSAYRLLTPSVKVYCFC
jgi:hypothetical protein